jgi:hypothetical protein
MSCLSAGQTQEEDQADHDQDFVDTSIPVNHPSNHESDDRYQQALGWSEHEIATSLAGSFIGEVQHAQPSHALPGEEVRL